MKAKLLWAKNPTFTENPLTERHCVAEVGEFAGFTAERIADIIYHVTNAPRELLEKNELSIAQMIRTGMDKVRATGAFVHSSMSVGDAIEFDGITLMCANAGWKRIN